LPGDLSREKNGWDECSADDCPMLPKQDPVTFRRDAKFTIGAIFSRR
jgi:hypothetical protein